MTVIGWLEIFAEQGGIVYFIKMSLVKDKINIMSFKLHSIVIIVLTVRLILMF